MGTIHRDTIKSMRKTLDEWMRGCTPSEDVNPHIFEYFVSFFLDELERLEEKIERVSKIADEAASHDTVWG